VSPGNEVVVALLGRRALSAHAQMLAGIGERRAAPAPQEQGEADPQRDLVREAELGRVGVDGDEVGYSVGFEIGSELENGMHSEAF
jgi:hypothetical protein